MNGAGAGGRTAEAVAEKGVEAAKDVDVGEKMELRDSMTCARGTGAARVGAGGAADAQAGTSGLRTLDGGGGERMLKVS